MAVDGSYRRQSFFGFLVATLQFSRAKMSSWDHGH